MVSWRRVLLITAGFIALGFGTVGIVIPVLPTTPFVLLAATCFANSSPKFYTWLRRNRLFGPFIDHYRNGTGVPTTQKVITLSVLWTGLLISAVLVDRGFVRAILAAVGVAVTWHVLSLRPRRQVTDAKVPLG